MGFFRGEISRLRKETGLLLYTPCAEEDNQKYRAMVRNNIKLPWNIIQDTRSPYPDDGPDQMRFFSIEYAENELNKDEVEQMLRLKNCGNLITIRDYVQTIKKWVTFFGILTLINLISSLILSLLPLLIR